MERIGAGRIQLDRIQAICFDVDGTLSDTDDVWTERLAGWLRPLTGLFSKRDPSELARRLVLAAETPGNFALTLFDRMGLDDEFGKVYSFLARHGTGIKTHHFRLIAGVEILLPALATRYPLAVISARDEATTLAFLDRFQLAPYFRCVATAQTCARTKPFADPLYWAAGRLGVQPAQCLMVGDTTVDIRMARAGGAQSVGVLCGFGQENELRRAGADWILPTTAAVESLLHDA